MNDIQLAKYLGWFSLGMGVAGLLASRRVAAVLGVGSPRLVQAMGAREVATGLMVLKSPDMAMPIWGRLAGDAMNVVVLAAGLAGRRRGGAAAGLAAAIGMAALDLTVATTLSQRERGALQTARRTRVQGPA